MAKDIYSIERRLTVHTEVDSPVKIDLGSENLSDIKIERHPDKGKIEENGGMTFIPKKGFTGTTFIQYAGLNKNKKRESGIIIIDVHEPVFKPRARLLLQLGDQLIKNESIALIELVKNSYDADSSYVNISLNKVDNPKSGEIIIEDDGVGMNYEIINNVWLEPGSDYKAQQVDNRYTTPKYNRLPIGEKGIGRFGVHKLGDKIELVSKKRGAKEVVVNIDWTKFKKTKYLNQIPIKILEREPKVFTGNKTGTRITIHSLRKSWERGMMRDVYRSINALATPVQRDLSSPDFKVIEQKTSFNTNFKTDKNEWIEDIPSWRDMIEYALFFFDIEIEGNSITKFEYQFRPWDPMTKLEERKVTLEDKMISDQKLLQSTEDPRNPESINLRECSIGKIKIRGQIFIKETKVLKMAMNQPDSLRRYLNDNGGVRVYRDEMRIYDYGEPENDWLNLDQSRFNNPGVNISNNMIIASVGLDRKESKDLEEKTNREGFINNKAYRLFRQAVLYSLKLILILRREDKDKIDAVYGPKREREPVHKTIDDLKKYVKGRQDIKKETKTKLNNYIKTIETNYNFMSETLIKSANAGLSLSIVIHEVEKIIIELYNLLKREKASKRTLDLARHLSNLIENYAQIIRRSTKKEERLKAIIKQALFNIEFRLETHNVDVRDEFKKYAGKDNIKISRSLIIGAIMNIFDNSLYWLDKTGKKNKKVWVNISEEEKGYLSLIIADNGPGIALSTDKITEPFVSAKPDGMGLGLHIAKEIMVAQKGKVSFNEQGDFYVPDEFKHGATVILGFKK